MLNFKNEFLGIMPAVGRAYFVDILQSTECPYTIRVKVNNKLREMLYIHASSTEVCVNQILIWISDDTNNDEWLALLITDVIPYFIEHNLFNKLGV